MRLTVAILALAALAGCAESGVVRVVDGRPVRGRYISETAYAFFVRGAEAEAGGYFGPALRAFELAAVEDPASPEIWTRLGALYCREAPGGAMPVAAATAFERARAADPSFGPLYRERARCSLGRGGGAAAVDDADRALAQAPDDLDTALVRAAVLERAGRRDDARRALRASIAQRPRSVKSWSALLDLARRAGDAGLAREAEGHVAALAHEGWRAARAAPEGSPLAGVDAALRAGNLPEAQRRALRARLPGAEVALRAAALGLAAPAREQAALVLGADPTDASARIALAAAADLRGDVPAVGDAMRAIPRRSTRPSPLGRLLLAEVLGRRVDAAAGRAWLGPEPAASGDDPLLTATDRRVRAALAVP